MLTKNEITSLNLSPTKKDFVQIWNELLEVAGKLSERWDPTSTNESDPGIVILKAVTGIADKLNYNIDKNTLEAFMPTAAQEDSMRKLCDMLGYTMKYYQSAVTTVNIKYYNSDPSEEEATQMTAGLDIPKFTVITNGDQDVSYFTLDTDRESYYISSDKSTVIDIPCMEGQVVKCESINDNNVITINQISENNRFYLPETQIAENGIFIYNVDTGLVDGTKWTKVDNLNVQVRGARVFKFGFDSYESRPYVEFPIDYSELFNEGIFVYYVRTSGVNGNISSRTLTQLELPSTYGWSNVSAESFSVENVFAATTGANAETIKQAYNNFKKTIGTFETLVTCRDYMNKIYSLINENSGKPLVSNILVTDIRNDLNRAVTICSCDDAGIFYKETPLLQNTSIVDTEIDKVIKSESNKPVYALDKNVTINGVDTHWFLDTKDGIPLIPESFIEKPGCETFDATKDGVVSSVENSAGVSYWVITQADTQYQTILRVKEEVSTTVTKTVITEPAIDHFDLVFYPFKSYSQVKNTLTDIRAAYEASFTYTDKTLTDIINILDADSIKTISHNIKSPRIKDKADKASFGDIVSINNYLRLNATVATNTKVNAEEATNIISNIKLALANAFNMRELNFGDEIPFDSIVEVIEGADTRIRVASLNEPALYTTFSVLTGKKGGTPITTEYAVASEWLDEDMSKTIGCLETVNDQGSHVSTFNTKEAKQIYNKLAVRNILAGRIPLFNYNNTFKAGFSEGAYQVTKTVTSKPACLPEPEINNPTVWVDEAGVTYTGYCLYDESADTKSYVYTETRTPDVYKDNIITEAKGENGTIKNYITSIATECKLLADEQNTITDVTLAEGEFVRFRAPNFTTIKTYPAYVNYHLDLNDDLSKTKASPASATSLFNILDKDRNEWSLENTDVRWQKVLDYFGELDRAGGTSYKKTFSLKQPVSAYKTEDNKIEVQTGKLTTTIGVSVNNTTTESSEYTIESLMALSGCAKLTNDNFKARVAWTPDEDETAPNGEVPLDLILEDFSNPFVTNVNVLADVKTAIDTALATYRDKLPTQCSFTVYLDFECVPFEAKSLLAWEGFIRTCSKNFDNSYSYQILDFKPVDENNNTILWRLFGDGYDIGRAVTSNTEKLLKFDSNYFGLLPESYLRGVYLVEDIGVDAKPFIIKNNEEYKLGQNEHLYIEYTPSAVSADGAAQELTAVTEVYGEGTIIRPSGFETGIMDSDFYSKLGMTPHKSVTFAQNGSNPVPMHRFGANEQVEIRDFAKVELSKDSFGGASAVYVYKNFNGCPELEEKTGKDGNRSYTLKDGEYILYTDQNKSEFAYFTSGTQVTLEGDITLPEFDILELSAIFDSGIHEIPWAYKLLSSTDKSVDKIIFQEYQYITLGPEDTIKTMVLEDTDKGIEDVNKRYLSDNWQFCSKVEYVIAGNSDTVEVLPTITLHSNRPGNGWEASSILELDVTSSDPQTLRSTDKVETSLVLTRTNTSGGGSKTETIRPEPNVAGSSAAQTLTFKTNLACQARGNRISIEDIYSNPSKLKGFQLKVFVSDTPAVVKTAPGKALPVDGTYLTAWTGEPIEAKDYEELWNQVSLDKIRVATDSDNALRLSVSLLPNTYGVFCIYVDYTSAEAEANSKIWIEAVPGTSVDDITLLNTDTAKIDCIGTDKQKLSKLYLNQGINCIRVNKTGKIFIKASSDAQGTLYFDDLRLVNSQVIKYAAASDNDPVELYTKGLNINQLGYLSIKDEDSTKIDDATKTALKAAYVDKAYAGMAEVARVVEDKISAGYHKLVELLPKVQFLVDAEAKINTELDTIRTLGISDEERLAKLADVYGRVSTTLKLERALLTALENNDKADELEQTLADLLNDFRTIEVSQQQILKELDTLKNKAMSAAESFSNEDIIADFNESNNKTVVLSDVKAFVTTEIEDYYQEQLARLSSDLDQIVNSESKSKLLTILANLRTAETSNKRAELQAKVSKLSNIVENDIDTLLVDIEEAAAAPDYVRLISLLAQLRNTVDFDNIKILVSEIIQAISDSNDTQLNKLLTPFFKDGVFDTSALVSLTNNAVLLVKINNAYNKAQLKLADLNEEQVRDAEVTEAVGAIKTEFSAQYKADMQSAFEEVKAILDSIMAETEITKVLEDLEDNEDSQVSIIIDQLNGSNGIIKKRKELINDLTLLSSFDNWENAPYADYIKAAILSIWPVHMTARVYNLLASVEARFTEAISDTLVKFDDNETNLANELNAETLVIRNILDITSFMALFGKIKLLLSTREQEKANAELVTALNILVQDSDELTSALDAVSNGSNKNIVISTLINDWQNAETVVAKRQIQAALVDELNSAIGVDMRLFSVVADLLCPNITKLSAELESYTDDSDKNFYARLSDTLDKVKDSITPENILDLSVPADDVYLNLLKLSFDNFKGALAQFSKIDLDEAAAGDPLVSLLPKALIDDMLAIRRDLITYSDIEGDISYIKSYELTTLDSMNLEGLYVVTANDGIKTIISTLYDEVKALEEKTVIEPGYEKAFSILTLENQLLEEIRRIDTNREFYYNVPVADSLAIELNESDKSLNTLMNPLTNYDINNVNNSFVISKLDIDYLDSGIKIARSSRLN